DEVAMGRPELSAQGKRSIRGAGTTVARWGRAGERAAPARPDQYRPWAGRVLALRAQPWFIAGEMALAGAALALVAVVKAHPGPLPGDIRLTLAWQRLVRPHALP